MKTKFVVLIVCVAVLVTLLLIGGFSTFCKPEASPKAEVGVQVVYAYIGHPTVDSNVTGLDYDVSANVNGNTLASYVVVLRATNLGAEMFTMTDFHVYVAPQITYNAIGFNDSNGNPAKGSLGSSSIEISNALLSEERAAVPSGRTLSYYLESGDSKLIAITGLASFDRFMEQNLQNGTLYVYGSVVAQTGYADGHTTWSSQSQTGYALRQVTFENVGGDYLYNALLGENQTLIINGLTATVSP
jgi:hypothetical protein